MGVTRIVKVNIDRVVLRGIDPADRHAFVQGLRAELTRILADPAARAAFTQSRRLPVLRLGRVQLDPGRAGARRLGAGIANSVGRRLPK